MFRLPFSPGILFCHVSRMGLCWRGSVSSFVHVILLCSGVSLMTQPRKRGLIAPLNRLCTAISSELHVCIPEARVEQLLQACV